MGLSNLIITQERQTPSESLKGGALTDITRAIGSFPVGAQLACSKNTYH